MRRISDALYVDIVRSVEQALAASRIIEVSSLADALRRRHEIENMALEDIEALIVQQAGSMSSAMVFDRETISPRLFSPTFVETTCTHRSTTCVELISLASGTVVRITEEGVIHEREFEREEFARSFAEGQRLRLGLPKSTPSVDQ